MTSTSCHEVALTYPDRRDWVLGKVLEAAAQNEVLPLSYTGDMSFFKRRNVANPAVLPLSGLAQAQLHGRDEARSRLSASG